MDFQSISAGIAGIAGFPRALYARGKYFFGGGKKYFFQMWVDVTKPAKPAIPATTCHPQRRCGRGN
jgi:hypothetical protein